MSFETEVMRDIKGLSESIKATIMENVVRAVRSGKYTIEDNKLPGLDKIVRDSVDQTLANSSRNITETLKKYSKQFVKKE